VGRHSGTRSTRALRNADLVPTAPADLAGTGTSPSSSIPPPVADAGPIEQPSARDIAELFGHAAPAHVRSSGRRARSGSPHATLTAADFLAARGHEFAAPRRSRSAAKAYQKRPVWRRAPAIPVVAVALAVWGAGDALHVVGGGSAASLGGSANNAAADLSALASSGQSSQDPVRSMSSERVSRSTRPLRQDGAANTSEIPLPARPALPKVQPGKTVLGTWVRPSVGAESSCFCMRWGVMHEGIDLAGPLGAPIVAVGDGVVVEAGPSAGFGHWIVIQHSNGDLSIYGHMYTVLVSVGQHVTAGEHIADIGADGQSTGPHLHFGVRLGGMTGPYIDPIPWLRARGISIGPYDPNA
jgi:murein DD-endopeptidase MepM/ murein hydrolase activator NlpD